VYKVLAYILVVREKQAYMIWPFLAIFDILAHLTKTKVFIVTGMEHMYQILIC